MTDDVSRRARTAFPSLASSALLDGTPFRPRSPGHNSRAIFHLPCRERVAIYWPASAVPYFPTVKSNWKTIASAFARASAIRLALTVRENRSTRAELLTVLLLPFLWTSFLNSVPKTYWFYDGRFPSSPPPPRERGRELCISGARLLHNGLDVSRLLVIFPVDAIRSA